MSREDLEKLLGGYATGTLTPEEQQALFEAALSDQELFNALAREQALRDLLRDPAARVHLLAALDDAPAPRWSALWARLRRPVAVAVAMAGVAGIGVFLARRNVRAPQPSTVARVRPPAPIPAAGVQAESQTRPAPVRAARQAKAKKLKVAQPAPAAEAPEVVAGVRPPEALTLPPPQALRNFQNARALFYAAPVHAENAGAVPPSASNQAAPVQQQRVLAARDGLLPPATPVSPASVVHLGVRYSVLRKLPGGEFAEVDPNQELPAGETVKLRFVPNDSGYLYVLKSGPGGSRQTVAMSHVERLTQFETPELKSSEPGQKEYYVLFTRRPQAAFLGAATQAFAEQSRTNLIRTAADLQERATYVVSASGGPDSQQVSFAITLKYK
jgi:hypothetical protein